MDSALVRAGEGQLERLGGKDVDCKVDGGSGGVEAGDNHPLGLAVGREICLGSLGGGEGRPGPDG